jgi:hypothetical protein
MVNGLSVPRAGETPDYTATAAYPEWYQLDPNYAGTGGIVWFDGEDNQMEPADTFVEGEKYKVEIKLIPAKLEGVNTSRFTSPLSVYINGKELKNGVDGVEIYSNSDAVYVYYTMIAKSGLTPTPTVKYGDLNNDGKIDAADALMTLKAAVGKIDLNETEKKSANVNGDGIIDVADALLILKKAVNKIEKFPVE